MKKPGPPPKLQELLEKHLIGSNSAADLILRIHQGGLSNPAPEGRYRHFHKLQFLQPPAGLSHETWWLAIKMARRAILRPWPLQDVHGAPFEFAMPDILWEMVHQIDRRASGTIESPGILPGEAEQRSFLVRSLIEEAITSSQLEGAATTRKVAKQMLRDGRQARNKSEQMILNNFRGMGFITREAKDRPLDPELVFELHVLLTQGTLDDPSAVGRFRREDEEIAVVDPDGEVLHDPPRAAELPDRLAAMCAFANAETGSPFIHPVVRSVLLHFWLAYDHPFVDGNGRTARALFYWSMMRRGYWLIEHTSISRLLLRARSRYARAFVYAESDENDATYFILHQCRTILQAIDELHAYIARKADDARRSRELLRNNQALKLGLNHRQLALIRHAIDHPGLTYTIKGHRRYHNVSYQTARTDLLAVAASSLLVQAKVGKEFVFVAPDDLRARLEGCGDQD